MAYSFAGKTAVVTGGSTGIGHAAALSLGRAGAHVVVGSLFAESKPGSYDERPELTVVDLLKSEGHSAEFVKTDVTSAAEVNALADRAAAHNGRIDVWVNNAGVVAALKPMIEYEDSELDVTLAVNTWGVWHGMRAALRYMMKQPEGGAIVNVLSSAGIRAHANQSVYNISKAASAHATRVAALEYGPYKIRVNAVCPTAVKTAIGREFMETVEFKAWMKNMVALGAPLEQQQVADAVVFLASDAASAMTGVMLPVDMGEQLGPVNTAMKQ